MAKTTMEWSLADCTVVMTRTHNGEAYQFSGFKEEAVQVEYMGPKYDELKISADGEHIERTATNDTRMKLTLGLFGGTEAAAYCDEMRFWPTDEDEVNVLIRNNRISREIRLDYCKQHNPGAVSWGKAHGDRDYEFQGGDGHINKKTE